MQTNLFVTLTILGIGDETNDVMNGCTSEGKRDVAYHDLSCISLRTICNVFRYYMCVCLQLPDWSICFVFVTLLGSTGLQMTSSCIMRAQPIILCQLFIK